jgi:hypothetical protein
MLSEGWNNEVLAARGESDDPNTSVFGALDPADQALCEERRSTAILIEPGVRSTIGPIVLTGKEQGFQNAEIRVAEAGILNNGCCVTRQRASP